MLTIIALSDDGDNNIRLTIFERRGSADPNVYSRIVGVGRAPAIALDLSDDGNSTIAAAFSDGFCQNNERQNKQVVPASCDQKPRSTSGVLSYALGSVEAWRSLEAFSACSDRLLYGCFSLGRAPVSTAIFQSNGIAVTHGTYNGSDSECGTPYIGRGGTACPRCLLQHSRVATWLR